MRAGGQARGARVAIVGSRTYPRPALVHRFVQQLRPTTVVVSGGARGVDSWAVDFARARGLHFEEYPADWDRYGKSAGYHRNRDLVDKADFVVAFWDGVSRGTFHTIQLALQAEKLYWVFVGDERLDPGDFVARYGWPPRLPTPLQGATP